MTFNIYFLSLRIDSSLRPQATPYCIMSHSRNYNVWAWIKKFVFFVSANVIHDVNYHSPQAYNLGEEAMGATVHP